MAKAKKEKEIENEQVLETQAPEITETPVVDEGQPIMPTEFTEPKEEEPQTPEGNPQEETQTPEGEDEKAPDGEMRKTQKLLTTKARKLPRTRATNS